MNDEVVYIGIGIRQPVLRSRCQCRPLFAFNLSGWDRYREGMYPYPLGLRGNRINLKFFILNSVSRKGTKRHP